MWLTAGAKINKIFKLTDSYNKKPKLSVIRNIMNQLDTLSASGNQLEMVCFLKIPEIIVKSIIKIEPIICI